MEQQVRAEPGSGPWRQPVVWGLYIWREVELLVPLGKGRFEKASPGRLRQAVARLPQTPLESPFSRLFKGDKAPNPSATGPHKA